MLKVSLLNLSGIFLPKCTEIPHPITMVVIVIDDILGSHDWIIMIGLSAASSATSSQQSENSQGHNHNEMSCVF